MSDASPDQTLTPGERERRWDLSLRLAIKAASAAEARAHTTQVLSRVGRGQPVEGEPRNPPIPAPDRRWGAGP